jgi:hypothetical protein
VDGEEWVGAAHNYDGTCTLKGVAPFFALVIESLVQHLHYFNKVVFVNVVLVE